MSAVAGGLASVAGGGKFENGAVTAAFGYLYNQLDLRRGRILNNPNTIPNLQRLNDAIVELGIPNNQFTITVTGADRYADEAGVIRSATDDSVVRGSATHSRHLINEGALAVDISVRGVPDSVLQQAVSQTQFDPQRTDPEGHYGDGHLHMELYNRPNLRYVMPEYRAPSN